MESEAEAELRRPVRKSGRSVVSAMRRDVLFLTVLVMSSLGLAAAAAYFFSNETLALVSFSGDGYWEKAAVHVETWEDSMLRSFDGSGNRFYPDHRRDTVLGIIPPPAQAPQVEGEPPPDIRVEIVFPPVPEMEWDVIAARWAREAASVARTALAVAWYESRWNPQAANPTCCASGLFQITMGTWQNAGCGDREDFWERRLNSQANTACAYKIYQRSGWREWSVFNEDVEPGNQVKVCPDDPFCRMPSDLRDVAEAAVAERKKWVSPVTRVVR